jgi:glycosyltransferase involved in cell wall biosynthesis
MMAHYILDSRTATPHFPGVGRYVRSLASAILLQLAHDEHLTLLVDPQHPLNLDGAEQLPLPASPFSLAQQWQVPRELTKRGANLYHSPYYLMPYAPGAPTVLTVYDVIPLRYPQFSSARARLLFRLTTRLALQAARHVIAITENARQDFVSEFDVRTERITAIPLGVDASFRPPARDEVDRVRAKYGLHRRYTLYLGSNKPHKNLVRLVQAWWVLSDGEAELAIAGAWDERYPEARQLAESRGDSTIRWVGRVAEEDLSALYGAADVFVFPSLFEGFGLPVAEAMACGTPVICSNVTALPEIAGDAAILIEPNDTQAIANALERVLGDDGLRATLRQGGLARAARFSWERTAAQTLAVYRQAAA